MALRGRDAVVPIAGMIPDKSADKAPAAAMGALFWLPFYIVVNLVRSCAAVRLSRWCSVLTILSPVLFF
jgi:hypothetical protein